MTNNKAELRVPGKEVISLPLLSGTYIKPQQIWRLYL
jgi:hypothetical protein